MTYFLLIQGQFSVEKRLRWLRKAYLRIVRNGMKNRKTAHLIEEAEAYFGYGGGYLWGAGHFITPPVNEIWGSPKTCPPPQKF